MSIELQEVFDHIVTHLSKQGKASLSDLGACAYRGENGTSCAIGCLIKDEYYSDKLEGHTINKEHVRDALAASLGCAINFGSPLHDLLQRLQSFHDIEMTIASNTADYERQLLQGIADLHGLTFIPSNWKTGE